MDKIKITVNIACPHCGETKVIEDQYIVTEKLISKNYGCECGKSYTVHMMALSPPTTMADIEIYVTQN